MYLQQRANQGGRRGWKQKKPELRLFYADCNGKGGAYAGQQTDNTPPELEVLIMLKEEKKRSRGLRVASP